MAQDIAAIIIGNVMGAPIAVAIGIAVGFIIAKIHSHRKNSFGGGMI